MNEARDENRKARQIVFDVTGKKPRSIRHGKGTACGWIYIEADATEPERSEISAALLRDGICPVLGSRVPKAPA